jgi:hypothetical protein
LTRQDRHRRGRIQKRPKNLTETLISYNAIFMVKNVQKCSRELGIGYSQINTS